MERISASKRSASKFSGSNSKSTTRKREPRARNLYRDPAYKQISARTRATGHSHFFNLVGLYIGCVKLTIIWTLITMFTQV
jgi:hypothetical protein